MNKKKTELSQVDTNLNVFFIISLIISWYVGFRMPNLWSINYYIPSFFDGFYRRGLMGTILSVFGDLHYDYYFICSIQFVVFSLLMLSIIRCFINAKIKSKIMLVLYFLSPIGAYLFHEIGYIDQLLYLLLFYLLCSSNKVVNICLIVASLFIHEEALFTIIPIYLANLIIHKYSFKYIAVNVMVILFTAVIMGGYLQIVSHIDVVNFVHKLVFNSKNLVRTDYYVLFEMKNITTNPFLSKYNGNIPYTDFTLMLMIIIALLVAALYIQKKNPYYLNVLYFFTVFFSSISPLLLGLWGVDYSRWIFLSISSCFVMLYLREELITESVKNLPSELQGSTYCSTGEAVKEDRERSYQQTLFSILVFTFICFSATTKLEYFDDYMPRSMVFYKGFGSFLNHGCIDVIKTVPTR